MKKLRKMVTILLSMIMVISCMLGTTAFATEVREVPIEQRQEILTAAPRGVLFSYQNENFYVEYNGGAFKSNITSSNTRVVVAAKRADGTQDGTINVDVYKKNLIGKTLVMRYTCDADGKAHTSGSFSVSDNANYVVDIYTSTSQKSVVTVSIAAA